MQQTFSIKAILKEAQDIMRPNLWTAVGQYLLIVVGLGILFNALFGNGAIIAGFITSFIIIKWALAYAKKGSFSFDELFEGVTFKHFIYFVCSVALVLISVIGGLLLLIIPGIIFFVRLIFVKYIAAEKQISPMAALKESKRLTKGMRWKIFGFICILYLINILGLICLVVGLFYTLPLTALAVALLYKKLSSKTEAEPMVEVTPETIEATA